LHLNKAYSDLFGYQRGMFPVAEGISDSTISLPLSPKMTDEEVMDVVRAVKKVARYYRRENEGYKGY